MNLVTSPAPVRPTAPQWEEPRPADGVELRQVALTLWRRKFLILAIVGLAAILGFVAIKSLTPRYTASATLLLRVKPDNLIDMDAIAAGLSNDAAMIRSEVDVLRSRSLAQRVIRTEKLLDDPEFNLLLQPYRPNLATRLGLVDLLPESLQRRFRTEPLDPADYPPEKLMSLAVNILLDRLTVANDGKSYTIGLTFDATDPFKAERITNAYVEAYLADQLDVKYVAAQRAASWIDQKLVELRRRVQEADQAAQKYREENHIVPLPGSPQVSTTLTNTQLAALNEQLVSVRASRAQAEAALNEMRDIGQDPERELSAPSVAVAPVVQNLRLQEVTLNTKLAELRNSYGVKHPLYVDTASQLEETKARLAQEVRRAVQGLTTAAQQARGQENELLGRLHEAQALDTTGSRANIRLRQLESEADAARSLFDTFLKGYGRANVQSDAATPDARVITYAEAPVWPSFPQVPILMALSVLVGLMISVGVVFWLESSDAVFRSPEQLEQATQIPVLGMIPLLPKRRGKRQYPAVEVVRDPYGSLADSLRSIGTLLSQSYARQTPRVVLVTSAIPGEGKTNLALGMARLAALSGRRVLLIEAELRRPVLAHYLRVKPSAGLAEFLSGEASFEQIVLTDPATGLDIIPATARRRFPAELLGTPRMAELIQRACENHELVVIDTPPISVAPDALVLGDMVDSTLLAVQWGKTPRSLVLGAVRKLNAANMSPSGVVLTQVNLRTYGSFGHGAHPVTYVGHAYYS